MSQETASSTEPGVGKTVHVQKNKTSPNWGFVQKSKLRTRPRKRRKFMTRKAGEEILFKEESSERQGRKIAETQRSKSRHQPEFISIIKGELCVIFQEFPHLWKEQRMWNIQSAYKISITHSCLCAKSIQSCLTLRPYGFSPIRLLCPWILQARILERVALSFSRGSSPPRDRVYHEHHHLSNPDTTI